MTGVSPEPPSGTEGGKLSRLLENLDEAVERLSNAADFAKPGKLPRVLDTARRVLRMDGGCRALEARAETLESSGVFLGSDWERPETLIPSLAVHSLRSPQAETVVIEALSELRLLAVSRGAYRSPRISAEQARHALCQVLALNLSMLFTPPNETERATRGRLAEIPRALLRYLAEHIGYEHVMDRLIEEIWGMLRQRPIQVDPVKRMIMQIAICRANPEIDLGVSGRGAERLVSSLYGPTQGCREDPGVEVYRERLERLDAVALQSEAIGFARAMHDTGLVSPYHPVLLRHVLDHGDHLLAEAMGLSATGRDCMLCYSDLIRTLIDRGIHPATAQAVYGLALSLERGLYYQPAVAPAMWRQIALPLSDASRERLLLTFGEEASPGARLLEGVLCMLGQPLGVGQGNNPTCQSARALSMWAHSDPDYLLQMVAWAARDDEIVMHFEGEPISSREGAERAAAHSFMDLDPVSVLVVPHLDRIYTAMSGRCAEREGDPHRWVNPEFHGWWSGRGFSINVDVATGGLTGLEEFLRLFYACYHPYYNGNQPVIHPQPAGAAVTDSSARFTGWHAITLLRVALDPGEVMRVYFFNPNNDSAQDWGDGVRVGTAGHGEMFGEASLPFEQFASRLYIFHFDPLERGELARVPREELDRVIAAVHRSWGADRLPPGTLPGNAG